MRVLVTGASGAIGRPVCAFLAGRGHAVRRFDRSPAGAPARDGVAPGPDDVRGELGDLGALTGACAGIEAIVHLAAVPDDAPFEQLVPSNVVGLYHLLDAARQHSVPRVVLASSVQVAWHRAAGDPRRTSMHVEPTNHYALTKVWAEQMGEMYARKFPMAIIAARIGWMVRDEREALRMREVAMSRHYISRRDVAHFMACAIEAPFAGFATFYAIGPEGRDAYDLAAPAAAIGYDPQDRFPAGLPFDFPPGPDSPSAPTG
jgi:nucleoside-diphosphate-sugar epimerase